MRTNAQARGPLILTHEGAPARRITPEQELRRSVMSCLLWEKEFYEDGQDIASRIAGLVAKVAPATVAAIASEARTKYKLRHIPLFLVRELARVHNGNSLVADTLCEVIQRADELAEFLAIYWKDGKRPISAQVKKGLSRAFAKFDEYGFAKYNRDSAVKLRDVMFLCHVKAGEGREELYKRIASDDLAVPDTWEVALSSGADKRATWERLISEGKLGALALLRNLRNMAQVQVPEKIIADALATAKVDRVLPYRFIAAARHNPVLEPPLEAAMFRCIEGLPKLKGKTLLLVDVSGSMDAALSSKSEMTRMDAACGLVVLARELCESVMILSFSDKGCQIPPRRGFALRDALLHSQPHSGTYLGATINRANQDIPDYDRAIVFTDEQSADQVPNPLRGGYMVNVASARHGVGYGPWLHIDGFSEAIFDYIREAEESQES